MSSDPQQSVTGLSSKFENEYTDINRLLDTVIGKNSRTAALVMNQDNNISETGKIGTNEKPSEEHDNRPHAKAIGNIFDKNALQDLARQSGNNESELNHTARFSQAETSQMTPVKSRIAPSSGSTAEIHRYGTPSQDGDYDYAGGMFSSPHAEVPRPDRKLLRELETVQEIPFDLSKGEETTKAVPTQIQANIEKYILPVVKRDINTTKLVDENLKHIHRDMHFLHKYAPEEVLRSIEKTPDGQFFVVDALKPEQKALQETIKKHPGHKEDPIDQIVVLSSPSRDIGPDEKILSVYQQVSEVYNDGTSYIGEKFLGLRQGQGTYYFQDGYRYEGTWEDDHMSGFGILWIDEIKWYEGEWKESTFHGKGIVYNLTPEEAEPGKAYMKDLNEIGNAWEKYEGKFSKGSKQGFGTLTLTNGETFTGQFESDNVHGRGSYVTEGGKKLIPGVWENNVLKRTF